MIDPAFARTWLMRSGRPSRREEWAVPHDADAFVIDVEDAVPGGEKRAALGELRDWLGAGGAAWVRIDAFGSRHWAGAVDALRGVRGLRGVVLAKTESAADVSATAGELAGLPVVRLVESARGLQRVDEIAAVPGVLRIGFGIGDFRRDTGVGASAVALAYPRGRIAVASTAAGLAGPIDGGAQGVAADSLRAQAEVALDVGFTGKFALLDSQLAPLNAAFAPDEAQIAAASELVRAVAAAPDELADGDALPRLERARTLLARATAYGLPVPA
ncbi:CoA ester lyase [Pseudoclavibacter chungangensis]|uniref:CoA ester lyase n=1 Tax=Pseudoclavibacter chungangensis TaxID=587635 RepID=A0A7J5C0T3_9MICO|nr:aldolase/citrate lyase family protein [Pseudoclavibacter chungangensis]KAB1659420.1 CoA ester lyase [Pseudoclavibacter chungangensis]NYJ67738.1 citrate lyase subunit beta/citryl-CoA lyase [Pseudoclavibacter chungangensis]